MFGCLDVMRANPAMGGTTWANRSALCGPTCKVCTTQDWLTFQGSAVSATLKKPADNFWLDDDFGSAGTAPYSCSVDMDAGAASGSCATSPMHLCKSTPASNPGVTDSTGDTCSLHDCGFAGIRPDVYLGGCGTGATDAFAGTLCCCP
jgi:hypothetical protein